jgi:hypothetical protein
MMSCPLLLVVKDCRCDKQYSVSRKQKPGMSNAVKAAQTASDMPAEQLNIQQRKRSIKETDDTLLPRPIRHHRPRPEPVAVTTLPEHPLPFPALPVN